MNKLAKFLEHIVAKNDSPSVIFIVFGIADIQQFYSHFMVKMTSTLKQNVTKHTPKRLRPFAKILIINPSLYCHLHSPVSSCYQGFWSSSRYILDKTRVLDSNPSKMRVP